MQWKRRKLHGLLVHLEALYFVWNTFSSIPLHVRTLITNFVKRDERIFVATTPLFGDCVQQCATCSHSRMYTVDIYTTTETIPQVTICRSNTRNFHVNEPQLLLLVFSLVFDLKKLFNAHFALMRKRPTSFQLDIKLRNLFRKQEIIICSDHFFPSFCSSPGYSRVSQTFRNCIPQIWSHAWTAESSLLASVCALPSKWFYYSITNSNDLE